MVNYKNYNMCTTKQVHVIMQCTVSFEIMTMKGKKCPVLE